MAEELVGPLADDALRELAGEVLDEASGELARMGEEQIRRRLRRELEKETEEALKEAAGAIREGARASSDTLCTGRFDPDIVFLTIENRSREDISDLPVTVAVDGLYLPKTAAVSIGAGQRVRVPVVPVSDFEAFQPNLSEGYGRPNLIIAKKRWWKARDQVSWEVRALARGELYCCQDDGGRHCREAEAPAITSGRRSLNQNWLTRQ